jgi:hypothetical protein
VVYNNSWHAFFTPYLQTELDRFLDVLQRLFFGLSLAHTAGDDRALDHVPSTLVLVDRYQESLSFHRLNLIHLGRGTRYGQRTHSPQHPAASSRRSAIWRAWKESLFL